ncbi:MAG: hypothetical protein DRP08_07105 [Candidatus Aenigmatarchaeota archaeon]|nr:MAG: hypothetical protein DRP08_07105 [Candidatus Aenigmarchaeota archaeon]
MLGWPSWLIKVTAMVKGAEPFTDLIFQVCKTKGCASLLNLWASARGGSKVDPFFRERRSRHHPKKAYLNAAGK